MSEEKLDLRKTIAGYLGIVYRAIGYWKVGLVVCVVVTAAGTVYAATRQKVWTSHTRIRVVSARVSNLMELDAMDQMHQDLESRLKQYTQSRRFLQEIVDEFGLYRDVKTRKNMTDEEVLDHMRGKLYWGVYEGDEFGFHFSDYDPDTAQSVCKRLAENFIQQRKVSDYSIFRTKLGRVKTQIGDVEARLEKAEARATRFKEFNADLIKQMRREQLGTASFAEEPQEGITGPSADTRARGEDSPELRRMRMRLRTLEENATRMRTKQGQVTTVQDSALGDQRAQVQRELSDARQRYARLRSQYTEEFPDVRAAKARVQELEGRNREIEARFRDFQTSTRQPSAELTVLAREIEETRETVRRMERRELLERRQQAASPDAAKMGAVEVRPGEGGTPAVDLEDEIVRPVKTVQEVETALKRIDTEIVPLRDQYQKLLAQKFDLEFQAAQREEGGMQYIVIDPANRPSKPSGPHRTRMALAAMGGGLFLGLGVIFLLGFVDPRLYRPADLDRVESVTLISSVPDFEDIVEEIAAVNSGDEAFEHARRS